MRMQVLLLALCAAAHGATRITRNLLPGDKGAPGFSFQASAPQPAPAPSYSAPQEPFTPSGGYLPPIPDAPPVQPPALYSPPSAPAPPPAPAQSYGAPVAPPAPAPPPPPPAPAQGYGAPSAPVEPPSDLYSAPVQEPVQPPPEFYGFPTGDSGESSEEATALTEDLIRLSAGADSTLSDSQIKSLLSKESNAYSGGPGQEQTGSQAGYSYNAPKTCQPGETQSSDGGCQRVKESTNYYLFDVPEAPDQPLPPAQIPERRLHYNVLLVRVPTANQKVQNVYPSRDEQKTLVYVVRDPPKGSPSIPPPVTEAYKPEPPAVFYVTPGAKASSEEGGHVGYGNAAEQEVPEPHLPEPQLPEPQLPQPQLPEPLLPQPSKPAKGYNYNAPAYG